MLKDPFKSLHSRVLSNREINGNIILPGFDSGNFPERVTLVSYKLFRIESIFCSAKRDNEKNQQKQ